MKILYSGVVFFCVFGFVGSVVAAERIVVVSGDDGRVLSAAEISGIFGDSPDMAVVPQNELAEGLKLTGKTSPGTEPSSVNAFARMLGASLSLIVGKKNDTYDLTVYDATSGGVLLTMRKSDGVKICSGFDSFMRGYRNIPKPRAQIKLVDPEKP